jgi:hypothetical protein
MNYNTDHSALVGKVWNYAHVLRDQGTTSARTSSSPPATSS